jgi:hypothetical protein
MVTRPVCIYCRQTDSHVAFKGRDHVIPECWGRFSPNNMVLHRAVCDDCNGYFGRTIELHLGRDTIEGAFRFQHGILSEGDFIGRRVRLRIATDHAWAGLIVRPKPPKVKDRRVDYEPVTQVGFRDKTTGRRFYFELWELPSKAELERDGFDAAKDIIYYGETPQALEELLHALAQRGITITNPKEYEAQGTNPTPVEGEVTIDPVICRGIAKIAFNYLTYTQGVDFVLSVDFDAIRRFIRYGEGDFKQFFEPNAPPILYEDRRFDIQTTDGHMVVVGWMRRIEQLSCWVSPFNLHTYMIIFCRRFAGIWRPIKVGHHFAVPSGDVTPMFSVPTRLLPR